LECVVLDDARLSHLKQQKYYIVARDGPLPQ